MRAYNQPQTMPISNHRMSDAQWVPTPHTFGWMKPDLIVVHETGTRLDHGSAVRYCTASRKTNPIRVGYHIIIERNGHIVQLARFNQKVRHAGVSEWKGRKYCNGFSIGIGLVGPTELKGTVTKARAFWKNKVGKNKYAWQWFYNNLSNASSSYHGKGHIWLGYTDAQIVSLNEVVSEIREAYDGIDIAGHYHVSPGRKIDPSPLLDIKKIGKLDLQVAPVEGIGEQELAHASDQIEALPPIPVKKADDSDKVLKKESREYKAANTLEKAAAGVTGCAAVSEGAKAFIPADAGANLEHLTTVKSYMDVVGGMISAYGVPLIVIAGLAVYGYCLFIKKWKRESYESGLYEPSGAE